MISRLKVAVTVITLTLIVVVFLGLVAYWLGL
jgi:hypothetical protein